jgi:hypothetical protein
MPWMMKSKNIRVSAEQDKALTTAFMPCMMIPKNVRGFSPNKIKHLLTTAFMPWMMIPKNVRGFSPKQDKAFVNHGIHSVDDDSKECPGFQPQTSIKFKLTQN